MTWSRCCILLTVVMLAFAVSVYAGGFQLNEHGARAMAQGGAFAARASDGSAIYFNPAGLGFMKGTTFMAGTTLIGMSSSFTSPAGVETKQVSQTFFPSNAYITHTMDNGLAFGIGFFNPFGLGTEWPAGWAGRMIALKTDLKTYFINPTIAYRINDQVSIGVGASYVWSDVTLRYNVPTRTATLAASEGTAELTANGNAINFDAGVVVKPVPELTIGASYRHQTKLDYTGTATFTNMQFLAPFFPGGEGKTTLKFPNNIFVGIAYAVSPRLSIEADFQSIGWSSYDSLKVTIPVGPNTPAQLGLGGRPLQGPVASGKDWSNAYMFRVGGEYLADPFAVRLGVIYDKTPQPDLHLEPMLPDANRMELTVGLGYKFTPAFGVDVAYQIILFSDRTAVAPNVFPGAYKTTANLVGLDLSYALQ